MTLESFFVDITGSSAGLIRAAGEGEAAAGSLESRLGSVSNGMGGIGKAAESEIGGKSVKNVSLLDKAFGSVGNSIKGALGGMLSMVGQTAGMGALFGGAAGLAEGVKLAISYNASMGLITTAYKNMGAAVPTVQINSMQASMTKLGFTEDASNAALLKLAQAHIPVNQQMAAMSTAADLARGKNMDLASAMNLLLMGVQGTGRGLQTLGINLPAVIPKQLALNAATAAVTKAQDAYNLALDKYGEYNSKTIAAHDKLSAATQKVTTDTAAMADHFAALPGVMTAIQSRVGGAAQAYVAANPFATMGADLQSVARVAGEALLPSLDSVAKWVSANTPAIEAFAKQAVGGLATAAQDAGAFIANDLYPPIKDVIGFVVDHKTVFEAFAGTLTAMWALGKVKSIGGSVIDDLKMLNSGKGALLNIVQKITGLGSSSGSSGLGRRRWSRAVGRGCARLRHEHGRRWDGRGRAGAGGSTASTAETMGGGLLATGGAATLGIGAALIGAQIMGGLQNLKEINDARVAAEKQGLAAVLAQTPVIINDFEKIGWSSSQSAQGAAALDAAIRNGSVTTGAQVAAFIANWQTSVGNMATVAQLTAGIVADARAVGTSAAFNQTGSITKQARIGMASGGILTEHVIGQGQKTGTIYDLAENGPERIGPVSGGAAWSGGGGGWRNGHQLLHHRRHGSHSGRD